MITDANTNKVYLADCLLVKHPLFFQNLKDIFDRYRVAYDLLPQTKDIWAVDYMPIQVAANQFVQFKYFPDYLQGKQWQKTISDVDSICKLISIKPIKSDIILDGGNVVKAADKVIMCDKVFHENPSYTKKQLTQKLRDLFQVDKIFFVPQQPNDYTGHADGMIRFLDKDTVLINDYSREKLEFQRAFKNAINNAKLDYIEIPYNPYQNKKNEQANGIYINYLQMENLTLLPVFGFKEDENVLRLFEKIDVLNEVVTIESNEIADQGGILNCISWNIQI